jgi:polyhydroxyalkanoate synthase
MDPVGALGGVTRIAGWGHLPRSGGGWAHFVGGGVESPRPVPTRTVSEQDHWTLRRYGAGAEPGGEPILLVPPLAVSIHCFDLRADQSLAAYLLGTGRPVYVVDYGQITFADRDMGLEDWFDRIVPGALREVSALHDARPVDVVTWSLGGTLSFLAAAAHPFLPLRSIAAIATPIDYGKVPYLVPVRAAGRVTGGRLLGAANRTLGGVPGWAVRAGFKATALQRELTKPLFVLRNLHDAETIGRMEAVDRFVGSMPGYPGRLYGQIYHRLLLRNDLAHGRLELSDRSIDLADVHPHVLVVAGADDAIAPVDCVRRACDVLTGVRSLRFETAPGSHLGVLTGPEAARTTWQYLSEFLSDVSAEPVPARR